MNAYDIEIEYDEENENYYAEHEFAYPSKRVRLNIDTDNSSWPTDESNSMTITIPSNPQTDTNNTWDDTTKTLTLTNLDQNTLITNNQNPTFNYATDLNINLSNYQSSETHSFNNSVSKINTTLGTVIADNNTNTGWTFYSSKTTLQSLPSQAELLIIRKYSTNYNIDFYANLKSTDLSNIDITVYSNSWVFMNTNLLYSSVYFKNNDNLELIYVADLSEGNKTQNTVILNNNLINFDGINWMTFD